MSTPSKSAHVLVVDDDEGLLILMGESLRAAGYEVSTAHTAGEASRALETTTPDLMFIDLKLPDASGPELIAELRRLRPTVPFIVVTGQGDEKAAVEVMKQGARDYLMKDSAVLELLPSVAARVLAAVAQEKALAAAQAEHKRLEQEILAVSERERQRIGADLHDNLGQQLTALELMCAVLKEDSDTNPALVKRLDMMGSMLREAVVQTRLLARGLVPVGREADALQAGLTELADRTNSIGRARCTFMCPEPVTIADPHVAGHLYRIAQEAVNNAVKHARAKNIALRLARQKEVLELEVVDDGVGLPKHRTNRGGLGMSVMQHRANVIGAELTIESRRGEGTAISCRLSANA